MHNNDQKTLISQLPTDKSKSNLACSSKLPSPPQAARIFAALHSSHQRSQYLSLLAFECLVHRTSVHQLRFNMLSEIVVHMPANADLLSNILLLNGGMWLSKDAARSLLFSRMDSHKNENKDDLKAIRHLLSRHIETPKTQNINAPDAQQFTEATKQFLFSLLGDFIGRLQTLSIDHLTLISNNAKAHKLTKLINKLQKNLSYAPYAHETTQNLSERLTVCLHWKDNLEQMANKLKKYDFHLPVMKNPNGAGEITQALRSQWIQEYIESVEPEQQEAISFALLKLISTLNQLSTYACPADNTRTPERNRKLHFDPLLDMETSSLREAEAADLKPVSERSIFKNIVSSSSIPLNNKTLERKKFENFQKNNKDAQHEDHEELENRKPTLNFIPCFK